MLYSFAIILFVLWFAGMLWEIAGYFIHLLLVASVVLLFYSIATGK